MIRTHEAGTLRESHAGTEVTLAGWVARRRDHGGVVFIDLRDASGVVQVVFREGAPAAAAHDLRAEYCVRVEGVVGTRPAGNENPDLPTGGVEVTASVVEVLSAAAPLPFQVEGQQGEVDEQTRLRYRYLDMRRADAARALRIRAQLTRVIRSVMDAHGFLDIETPTLTRSTPEGARDFLVPCRLQPGTWFALPQSPQLFKQLLMVAGFERYYQIARCYRDEDLRADRQPEFTQLDVELSFLDEEDVYRLIEELVPRVWREVLGVEVPVPFERMPYWEAMRRYGSDKPDLRFELELIDLAPVFGATEVGVFKSALEAGGHVGGVLVPGGASLTRKQLDGWVDWAKGRGGKGLAWVAVEADGALRSPLAKFFSPDETAAFAAACGAAAGDLVFVVADAHRVKALEMLGALRVAVAKDRGLVREGEWRFVWIVDAPMFERTDDGGWTAVHHPFTAPAVEWEATFDQSPADALARAYDLVLNGVELGGGSIRIHRSEMQRRVFDTIGLTEAEAKEKFGFLLEAFEYGPPPHGGIAFGLDRLAMMLAEVDSIREVIAFPKTASGGDPLTGAPTPISPAQRKEAGVDVPPPVTPG
ncbi:MAG TPA: aspartate--tRNA ligase [Mycobacteriales bacterium]|jgi:aspartyl-tRNA synthetase|nr:aspartate--tRNA ligase [Mycobacteriales bacterium]